MIPPALLVKAFGKPGPTEIGFAGTGTYNFEDTSLDVYKIIDYKKTDYYHGLNREDDYYLTTKNLKKPGHKRSRKWPSIDEFWASNDPVEFRLIAGEQADWRKFRRWLRKHLQKIEESEFDYDKEALAKWEPELDICLGDFNK